MYMNYKNKLLDIAPMLPLRSGFCAQELAPEQHAESKSYLLPGTDLAYHPPMSSTGIFAAVPARPPAMAPLAIRSKAALRLVCPELRCYMQSHSLALRGSGQRRNSTFIAADRGTRRPRVQSTKEASRSVLGGSVSCDGSTE